VTPYRITTARTRDERKIPVPNSIDNPPAPRSVPNLKRKKSPRKANKDKAARRAK